MKKIILYLLLLASVLGTVQVCASGFDTYTIRKKNSGGEEVHPNTGYFDLKMKPGEKRTISVEISNNNNESITVMDKIITSYTNENGEIEKSTPTKVFDASLKMKMNDIANISKGDVKKEVSKHSKVSVSADIEVPKDATDGVILGSWHFDNLNQNQDRKKGGTAVYSKYTMSLGIKITVNKEVEQPNVNLLDISTGLLNYKKVFFAKLQNDQPAIIGKVAYEGIVCKKGESNPLYKNNLQDLQLAPNSNYKFPIFLGEEALKPGEYTYRLEVTSSDPKWKKRTWKFTKDFSVSKKDADRFNEEALNDPKPDNRLTQLLISIILILVTLVLTLIFLLWKRRKGERNDGEDII